MTWAPAATSGALNPGVSRTEERARTACFWVLLSALGRGWLPCSVCVSSKFDGLKTFFFTSGEYRNNLINMAFCWQPNCRNQAETNRKKNACFRRTRFFFNNPGLWQTLYWVPEGGQRWKACSLQSRTSHSLLGMKRNNYSAL